VIRDAALRDPRYNTLSGRREHEPEIDAVIEAWTSRLPADEAAALLQTGGVSATPVLSPLMVIRDEHLAARQTFQVIDHPAAGPTLSTRPVWRLKRRAMPAMRPAPCFGEHNVEVLRELAGCSEDEIREMAAANVIATAPVS
jgi:crotonobetainyl-CoA:carnitine CoA-transferase CaiB-like acyl-CoA transferase